MQQARAAIGGEYGVNGEWYEGGKFIATTRREKKHREKPATVKPTGRQEIEPYVWEFAPALGMRSLLHHPAMAVCCIRTKTINDTAVNYYRLDRGKVEAVLNAYLSGQRWYNPETEF